MIITSECSTKKPDWTQGHSLCETEYVPHLDPLNYAIEQSDVPQELQRIDSARVRQAEAVEHLDKSDAQERRKDEHAVAHRQDTSVAAHECRKCHAEHLPRRLKRGHERIQHQQRRKDPEQYIEATEPVSVSRRTDPAPSSYSSCPAARGEERASPCAASFCLAVRRAPRATCGSSRSARRARAGYDLSRALLRDPLHR